MAGDPKQITDLDSIVSLHDDDVLEIVDVSTDTSYKIKRSVLFGGTQTIIGAKTFTSKLTVSQDALDSLFVTGNVSQSILIQNSAGVPVRLTSGGAFASLYTTVNFPLRLGANNTNVLEISSTGVKFNSGTEITKILSATDTLDFASIGSQASSDLTIAVTGAAAGDSVFLGLPASPAAGIVFNAFVSAADTVTVRAHNYTGGAVDPASATYRVTVVKF